MHPQKTSHRKGKKKARTAPPYPFEFRLRIVRLYLEDGYQASLLAQEFGISEYLVYRWSRAYRKHGEAGLKGKIRACGKTRVSEAVRGKIVEIRKSHPRFGSRRIADILKRLFLVPTSASTVQRTLAQEGLVSSKKVPARKNPAKPRFFERATANQMWQSDIMTFRLAGLLDGVCEQKPDRPTKPAPAEETALEKHLAETLQENQLLRRKLILKDLVYNIENRSGSDRTKKNERITQAVALIEELKIKFSLPYHKLIEDARF